MTTQKFKKISIGIILFMIFLECNMGYSKADTSSLIEQPPVCVYKSYYSAIKITMGNGTCEYYYIFASPTEFSEYNKSFVRLERFYNGRVMNPHPDIDYSDCSYDVISIINYWRLPSNWTECYFGVVCVNESSDLWSYPVISQKISIPEGLEPPEPDPIDPDPTPTPTPTPTPPSFEDFLPILIIGAIGLGLILLVNVINYGVTHFSFTLPDFRRRNSENNGSSAHTTTYIRKSEVKIFFYKIIQKIKNWSKNLNGFFYNLKIKRRRRKIRKEIKLEENKWTEFSSIFFPEYKDIENLILKNKFYEGYIRLKNLKKEIEKQYNNQNYSYRIKNFINEEIDTLIKTCEIQKEILEKCNRIYSEFKSSNEDSEIAREFFVYCSKVCQLCILEEITDEFLKHIVDLKNQINKILKEKLIKAELSHKLKMVNDFGFLDNNLIDYFKVLEKWRILKKIEIDLEKIILEKIQDYFEKGSVNEIMRNISWLTQANLEENFLQDIGLLVEGRHEIKKHIKEIKPDFKFT